MMIKVLFVDDEQFVLDGLKRMLHRQRDQWQMSFVNSGAQALALMEKEPFDVVVTDMRMPGMTGHELLEKVRELHPEAMRFVLSGQTDRETALKSANSAHQFLSKPCDPDRLREAVERAGKLTETLRSPKLRSLVTRLRTLPTLPALYSQIVEEVNKPEPSLARVSEILEQDVGMTVKILQMVNSAFFGSPRRAMTAADAASLLGMDTLKALVTAVHVFEQFPDPPQCGFDLAAFESHSLRTGAIAKGIARHEGLSIDDAARALMVGILHDVGTAVLAAQMPKAYDGVTKSVERYGQSVIDWERKLLGATHAELGAFLLGLWGFPNDIVEATAFHREPGLCAASEITLVDIVHASSGIECCIANQTGLAEPYVCLDHFANKGASDKLRRWYDVALAQLSGSCSEGGGQAA